MRALQRMAADAGIELPIVAAAEAVNRRQRRLLAERVLERFGPDLRGHVIGLWGLAFKPETDDLREAPAIDIVGELLRAGARVRAYDPQAQPDAAALWGEGAAFEQVGRAEEAARGASALLLVTEWRELRSPDFAHLAAMMRTPLLFDGRNQYSPLMVRAAGFEYVGIGRPIPGAAVAAPVALPLAA
jgi:UDPglucose 6-dehydrogenase